jgi:hypothetical protein
MPQHTPPPPDDHDDHERPGYIRFDPDRMIRNSPLRRALRAAGLRTPFGLGRRPEPPTTRPDNDLET